LEVGIGYIASTQFPEQSEARGREVGTGREDLAEPKGAGPALRPFKIYLHSFRRKIKSP
jgi:hypothetical protein